MTKANSEHERVINDPIRSNIAKYYDDKIQIFGATNRGVDWSSESSQLLRFDQLTKAIDCDKDFSILDYGCGYGAYLDYLSLYYDKFQYIGIDISKHMIDEACKRHHSKKNSIFLLDSKVQDKVDYVISSGIFNVKLNHDCISWDNYFYSTLNLMAETATRAFAFNCLTIYSDKNMMEDRLYYADPMKIFDYCKRHFSRNVALLHDYDLYEFTIIVRKQCG